LTAGYYVAGHGVGESCEERRNTVSTVFEDLPEAKVRLVNGLGGLEEILEAVRVGFDVLESR
jgi:tRNA-guanine family transglycosylase